MPSNEHVAETADDIGEAIRLFQRLSPDSQMHVRTNSGELQNLVYFMIKPLPIRRNALRLLDDMASMLASANTAPASGQGLSEMEQQAMEDQVPATTAAASQLGRPIEQLTDTTAAVQPDLDFESGDNVDDADDADDADAGPGPAEVAPAPAPARVRTRRSGVGMLPGTKDKQLSPSFESEYLRRLPEMPIFTRLQRGKEFDPLVVLYIVIARYGIVFTKGRTVDIPRNDVIAVADNIPKALYASDCKVNTARRQAGLPDLPELDLLSKEETRDLIADLLKLPAKPTKLFRKNPKKYATALIPKLVDVLVAATPTDNEDPLVAFVFLYGDRASKKRMTDHLAAGEGGADGTTVSPESATDTPRSTGLPPGTDADLINGYPHTTPENQ